MTAKAADGEGGFGAEEIRRIETARHREISPLTWPFDCAQSQHLPRQNANDLEVRHQGAASATAALQAAIIATMSR